MRRSFIYGMAMAAVAALAPAGAYAGEAEDNAMAARVAENLKQSGRLSQYRIGVSCQDGTAWLEGDVTSNEQGVAALEIARQTEGVTEVVNRLTCPATPADGAMAAPATEAGQAQQTSAAEVLPATQPAMQPAAPTQMAQMARRSQMPQPYRQASAHGPLQAMPAAAGPLQAMPMQGAVMPAGAGYGQPVPAHVPGAYPANPARYDQPNMPGYAWPSYAAYPNYAAVTYPKQYSPTAWPYIGPFYPYPQVPLGWRKVTLEWDDGWWMLDFKD